MANKKATPEGATKMQVNSTTKADILSILKKYRRGRSRYELSQRLGVSDRTMRDAIAELRDEGYMIGTRADGGYSLDREDDFVRAIKIYESRRNKESKRIRNMKHTLELQGQVMIGD